MANWCAVDIVIELSNEADAYKLLAKLKEEQLKAEQEDCMVFIGSKTRYIDDLEIYPGGKTLDLQGDVKWGLDYDEMVEIIKWIESIVPIVKLKCHQDEGGCGVYGYYTYVGGKLTYRYIPFAEYPEFDEHKQSWYDTLEETLRVSGVEDVIDMEDESKE